MAKNIYIGANKEFTVTNLLDYNSLSNYNEYWGSRITSGQTRCTGWAKFMAPPGNIKCGFFYNNITTGVGEVTYTLTTNGANNIEINLNNSHKYYFSIMLYQDNDSPSGSFDAYWPIQEPPLINKFKLSKGRTWEKISVIVTKTNVNNGKYPVRIDYNEPKNGYGMRFGNITLVDLTETFGVGEEPTKEWCDINLDFSDGSSDNAEDTANIKISKSVARKVKKIYIGGQHNFRNLFFLENTEDVIYRLTWSNSTGRNPYTTSAALLKDSPYSMVMYNESGNPAEIMRFIGGANRPLNNTHTYYFRCWLLQSEKNGSFDFYWKEQEPAVIAGATVSGNNQWTRVSTVFNRNGFTNGSYQARFDYNNPGVNKNLVINGVVLVDLTETFGSGNEPNKTWCDEHIPYIGTSNGNIDNVAKEVIKGYIGINNIARNCYNKQ